MTSTREFLTDAPLAGTLVGTDFDGWTDESPDQSAAACP